ncbi:transcription factor bHLH25-like isoform X2 [Silene latifolia]|uniref:transcription factor bHLH25-like isoform X2 n=1 Tax=Silene latifolia TaxID=37657 RepID=UPI003D787A8E
MDVPSSPNSINPWFAALEEEEEVDDPMLLQVFVGDCLVDYPAEDMNLGALLMEDNYTLSPPESECNSSSAAAAEITNNSNSNSHSEFNQHDTPPAPAPAPAPNTKRPKRLPDQSQNHIIAERQRRQNLSQRFIALSALIPGLKKMDKTSVLGEAITHMKQLKERVKILEEDKAKRAVESVVVVQRSRVVVENDDSSHSSSGVTQTHDEEQLFLQVEARFCNTSVLIKVHCQMQIGLLSKIINKIENIHLLVTNTCSMPFNNNTLDITIMTQMEPDFAMGPHQVVENIRSIF